MLLVTNKCLECGKKKRMDYHTSNGICYDCQKLKEKAKRDAHFTFLDGLPIEARIRKIEEWIYDYKP